MAQEIERKFLVQGEGWRTPTGARYRQGYLSLEPTRTVRVRTVEKPDDGQPHGYLTIKGKAVDLARPEYEYEIPLQDAHELLDRLCQRPLIEKIRHRLPVGAVVWEVDEFLGDNAGLVVAEVELRSADQAFHKPAWVGQEVTDDPRYLNANLVTRPFTSW